MKAFFLQKSVYIISIISLIITACSKDSPDSFEAFLEEWNMVNLYQNNPCGSVSDAVIPPEKWTQEEVEKLRALPDETISSMSTCGLLETLLSYPTNDIGAGPWCTYCNSLNLPGVTMFNESLQTNRIAVELLKRDDCFPALAYKYMSIIKENREFDMTVSYFEILLSSDMCMSVLDDKEKTQLMAMALERNWPDERSNAPYIAIAVMRSCNYAPFMSEISPNLAEFTWGYSNLNDYDIVKYAKNFLNERK